MTRYHVELDLICPSNWIDGDVRKYIERITPTREERESIKVTSLDPPFAEEQAECRDERSAVVDAAVRLCSGVGSVLELCRAVARLRDVSPEAMEPKP